MSQFWKKVRTPWSDALTLVGWDDFERRLAAYYGARGYRVAHTGTGASATRTDGGIDIKLYRNDEYIVVQCKHWNIAQVPHNAVHELIGVMHTQGASRAILITSGEFTAAAREAASRFPPIQLIDGAEVREMLGPIDAVTVSLHGGPAAFAHGAAPTGAGAAAQPGWVNRGPATRGRRRGAPAQLRLVSLVLIVVVIAMCWLYAQHTLKNMSASIQHMNQQNITNSPSGATGVTSARASAAYERQRHGTPMTRMGTMATPGGGSIAVSIGPPENGPDNSQGKPDSTPQSKAAMEQWQRENAKSMKILEKSTPEL